MYVKLSWRPEVDENWAMMIVQPTILTYPTMVFYFWLAPQVLWNDIRGIIIKQRHVGSNKTIYLCLHPLLVPMAARISIYLNKYVRRGLCLIYISSFYFWSPLAPQVLWNDIRGIIIKQRHWQTFWGIIHVDQATLRTGSCLSRISIYLNKYVRRGLCLIYISSFYFWSPPLPRKIRKTNMRYYPEYPSGSWHPILASS
jgi:hypothetical protein